MDFSSSPVNLWVVLHQPGVLQDDVVLFSEVQHEEILYHVPSINPEMEFDLMTDHFSRTVGSISISGMHRLTEFLQQPLHSPGHVEIDAAD